MGGGRDLGLLTWHSDNTPITKNENSIGEQPELQQHTVLVSP